MMRALIPLLLLCLAVPAAADESEDALAFAAWLTSYRTEATARGLQPAWIDATLADVRLSPRVMALDRSQPGSNGAPVLFGDYLAAKLRGDRIPKGQEMYAAWAPQLDAISRQSGVPRNVIAAIWGIETSYGRVTGNFDLPSALATLAFEGRRRDLFTRELDALVRIVGEGRMPKSELKGSWAGAFGHPQFLPSSYLGFAADGDGDGKADLVASVPDALASIANYLRLKGWQAGQTWGFRVIVPTALDRAGIALTEAPKQCVTPLSRHSRPLPAAEWRRQGLVAVNAPWPADATPMTLIEPDGPGQGGYLTTASYRAILQYNCSNYYGLAVGLLADAIGAP